MEFYYVGISNRNLIKNLSQNVGTIAAIREDFYKIEWFWDGLKNKIRYSKFPKIM
ncbi:hypothetical protein LEP1GSC038_3994 [Leptospira weilii str. 2006001855]|uniref:Uncharacterized protein n=2 Tax=Leptospira weilii TaxID=28184 RepID=M6PXG8_9LEPT|nr:hypothetical protein LEP1GSC038_3994 [Leptospira weilii str. 2006001855]EMN87824.1 hypothetical protein LEP1GSC108_1135 [Leptospira weilii str. UI 13098]